MAVNVTQAAEQSDPAYLDEAKFTVTFGEAIDLSSFDESDILLSGTTGTVTNLTQIIPNDGTTFEMIVTGMTDGDTVVATIEAGKVNNAAGTISNLSSEVYESCYHILSQNSESVSGVYQIDVDGIGATPPFDVYCDMTTDGGGWTLVLNYLHKGGTNPELKILNSSLPLLGENILGNDESDSETTWGHLSNSLATQLNFNEMRFYSKTSGNPREINFKTSLAGVISYVKSGSGSMEGINVNFTSLEGHSAVLPAGGPNLYINQGDLALTNFPFWRAGAYHWGIKGGNVRWESDDYPGNDSKSTYHQVWTRTDFVATSADNSITKQPTPKAPGGEFSSLKLWIKADFGALNTGDQSPVTGWTDQSMTAYDFSDVGTTPYVFEENRLNFNPTINNPDGSNRRLSNPDSIKLRTISIVTIPNNPDGCDNPFSENSRDSEGIRACGSSGNWRLIGDGNDFAYRGKAWYNGLSANYVNHNNTANIVTVEAPELTDIDQGIELGDTLNNRFWHGDIAEVIGFENAHSDSERKQVLSYLALKYGISLDQSATQNYIASDESVIWDAEIAEKYKHDIAGIGQDDASDLNQKISKSVNSDGLITIASSEDFSSPNNNSERTDLGNLNFITWSNNDGGLVFTTTGAPSGRRVVNRRWKVQETGEVGSVFVSIPDNSSSEITKLSEETEVVYLLINNDDDFLSSSDNHREIELTLNGENWQGTIDFSNGEFFTIATQTSKFPASINNGMQLWLDSSDLNGDFDSSNNEANGSEVQIWTDKSGNGNDAAVLAGQNAAVIENNEEEQINGHPVMKFNRTAHAQGSVYNTPVDIRAANMEDMTMFLVYKPKASVSTHQSPWGNDDGDWDRFFYSYHNGLGDGVDDGIVGVNNGQVVRDSGKVGEVYIQAVAYDGNFVNGVNSGIGNSSTVYLNGEVVSTFRDTSHATAAAATLAIGWDGDDGAFDGQIAEVILYDRILDACEMEQIHSYLGDKYGRDVSGSTSSYNLDAPYIENIASIGTATSACGGDYQINQASSGELTVNGATENDTAGEFLSFAHDDLGTGNLSNDVPQSLTGRISQAWRVDEDGSLGTVDIRFDLSALGLEKSSINNLALLVDSNDGIFVDANIYAGSDIEETGYHYENGAVTFFNIDLNDSEYFTVGIKDTVQPTVTVEQATVQSDPEQEKNEIDFTVQFSESISSNDFSCDDVIIEGSATAECLLITEVIPYNGTMFELKVSASTDGTLIAKIKADGVTDRFDNHNTESSSLDNSVDVQSFSIATSRQILAQVGLEADIENEVDSVTSIDELSLVLPPLVDLVQNYESMYQEYIDANPSLFSVPATQEELQNMINVVYLENDDDLDGLSNGQELSEGTDPNDADSDDNGICDGLIDAEPTCIKPGDNDGDGVSNTDELLAGTDPNDVDSDGDGVSDFDELSGGSNPLSSDGDGDGVCDGVIDITDICVAGPDVDPNDSASDSDMDGISDLDEKNAGSHPVQADSDGDGLCDGVIDVEDVCVAGEDILGELDSDDDMILDALDSDDDNDGILTADELSDEELVGDIDEDGIPAYLDLDSDNDGFDDETEGAGDIDRDEIPNYLDVDSDGDGSLDIDEGDGDLDGDGVLNYADPDDSDGADADPDEDGLTIGEEVSIGSDPYQDDSDGDGIKDGDEVGSDVLEPVDTDDDGIFDVIDSDDDGDDDIANYLDNDDSDGPAGDMDDDGLTNSQEEELCTDPTNSDSDGDGILDGIEITNGTDPLVESQEPIDDEGDKQNGGDTSDNDDEVDAENCSSSNQTSMFTIVAFLLPLLRLRRKKRQRTSE